MGRPAASDLERATAVNYRLPENRLSNAGQTPNNWGSGRADALRAAEIRLQYSRNGDTTVRLLIILQYGDH